MTQPFITVPIALSCTRSATITLPWFVQRTEYNPAPATFKPLVNGETAFRDIYDAIFLAVKSVDIICWGFQPSMFFKRGAGGQGTKCIGELLEDVGKRGVKVRLLCWGGQVLGLPEINNRFGPEPNMPHRPAAHMRPRPHPSRHAEDFDRWWYWSVAQKDPRRLTFRNVVMDPSVIARHIPSVWQVAALKNVEFMTRDFDLPSRLEIAFRTSLFGADKQRGAGNKAAGGAAMGLAAPTHHQKMVLVDYEVPNKAVGYVMGHNMLDPYWDTDDHSATKMPWGYLGRNGATPRHDISSRVTGPILQYLNDNFCEAWDRETGTGLGKARKPAAAGLRMLPSLGDKVMAQVLRTHSQNGKQDIEEMYLQAVNNATQFIYIENQYFRFKPLADKINEAVKKQIQWGRDPGQHGAIHLFVITNSSDEGMGDGTVNTYRMLNALGRAEVIPGVAKLEQEDVRQADLQRQYDAARAQAREAQGAVARVYQFTHLGDAYVQKLLARAEEKLQQARAKQAEAKAQMKEPPKAVLPAPIDGLKVHICTLVAPDSPPDKWQDVYIHAKLMIVDDVFMTLGSANINTRSMEGDSELNICHENEAVTRPLRRKLWHDHTRGMGDQDDPAEAFAQWTEIIEENKSRQEDGGKPPHASLIEFRRDDPKRTYKD